MFALDWGAQSCTQHSRCGLTSGEDHQSAGYTPPKPPQPPDFGPSFLQGRITGSCSWCPPGGPSGPFLPSCFPDGQYMALFLPRHRTLHFPWLNFVKFLSSHFCSPLRPHCMAAHLLGLSNILVFKCHNCTKVTQSLYLSIKPTCCTLTMAWPHSALFWIYRTSGIFKVTFTCGVYVVFFHA